MSSFFEMEMGVVYVCLHVGICIRVDRFPSFSIVFHCSFLDLVTYKFHQPLQNSSKKLLNASIWDMFRTRHFTVSASGRFCTHDDSHDDVLVISAARQYCNCDHALSIFISRRLGENHLSFACRGLLSAAGNNFPRSFCF